jgi:crotonobetainyl-CoA:carnitine CoA-transferase CaiB-like acyl-CoA transferase
LTSISTASAGNGPLEALAGVHVLDLSDAVAGSYCAKLLVGVGARVTKVEPPGGHPLRRWSASGSVGADGDPDGVLFRHLAGGQRSVVLDLEREAGRERILDLVASTDLVVESFAAGRLADLGIGPGRLWEANPALTVVSITPFGQEGPRCGDARSEFLLQAAMGALDVHGEGVAPLAVGGRLGEWATGTYAAAGALAARARTQRNGQGEWVDVSALECLTVTMLSYPTLFASFPGGSRSASFRMVPGIEACKDGYVGLATITVQQWHDVLAMIERTDLMATHPEWDDQKVRQRELAMVTAEIGPWFLGRTQVEILERAAAFRVPAAPVSTGGSATRLPHVVARELFRPNPRGAFPDPRPPFRTNRSTPQPAEAAPRLGNHDEVPVAGTLSKQQPRSPTDDVELPLEGVRILDLTAFWAGPFGTQYLATLGADVIKIESVQHPDPMRFSVTVPPATEQWYEQGSLFMAINLNKRGITLDLSRTEGRDLFLRLVATADVVVENFTPRVMENFGLTYEVLQGVRSDLIMLRMPGWGLDGPWRDRPAFASTMEQASGIAWMTGRPEGPPELPGICDPLTGVHAAFAVLAALEERRRTGEGQQVELAMLDLAANVSVEQVLEYAAYGHLMERQGNRGPAAAPQGVYPTVDHSWLALAVGTDEEWQALCRILRNADLAKDVGLRRATGRRSAHDRIDREVASWSADKTLDEALSDLRRAGVPAEAVVSAYEIDQEPQMNSRGFWEDVPHPVVGTYRYPGWPMRLSGGPDRWYRRAAPLLGQHNEEVLRGLLGLTEDELASLRDKEVIGDSLLQR